MVKITLSLRDGVRTVHCRGHAEGRPDVCAAVSTLVQTLSAWLSASGARILKQNMADGLCLLAYADPGSDPVFQFVRLGLRRIEAAAPAHVSVAETFPAAGPGLELAQFGEATDGGAETGGCEPPLRDETGQTRIRRGDPRSPAADDPRDAPAAASGDAVLQGEPPLRDETGQPRVCRGDSQSPARAARNSPAAASGDAALRDEAGQARACRGDSQSPAADDPRDAPAADGGAGQPDAAEPTAAAPDAAALAAAETVARWEAEAAALAERLPGFSLADAAADPRFRENLARGFGVEEAFAAAHLDELVHAAARLSAAEAEQRILADVRARGLRPEENGVRGASGFTLRGEEPRLSRAGRADIARRVARGETVRF